MTIPMPNSNIRRFYTPSGAYLGFDNYGPDQRPSVMGLPAPIATVEGPSESEMLRRQYQPQPTTENFMSEMSGTSAVGLKTRALAKDGRWLRLRQTNPEAADAIYQQVYGVTPDQDAYADEYGYTTLAQLRSAQQKPAQLAALRQNLAGFEAQHGFNANYVAQDLDRGADVNAGHFSGYDEGAGGVWLPQYDSVGNQTRSRFRPVAPYVARATRQQFQQLYGGGASQMPVQPRTTAATTAMPQAWTAADDQRFDELHRKAYPNGQVIPFVKKEVAADWPEPAMRRWGQNLAY